MMRAALLFAATLLSACGSTSVFKPQSEYPPDPYVKNYAAEDDCIGGEALAAISFDMPEYPGRAFRTGRQGWVILNLDVAADGTVASAIAERALPDGLFENSAEKAARNWLFEPPGNNGLTNCRVLIRYRFGDVTIGS